MHEWERLSHVKRDCKCHWMIVSKYSKKVLHDEVKQEAGEILRNLCRQRGVELLEGHLMPDHIQMCLQVPPKFSMPFDIGFLKGKSAVRNIVALTMNN